MLLMNLGNVRDAAAGDTIQNEDLLKRVREEGAAVLRAAGIAFTDVGPDNDRRKRLMQVQPVAGAARVGSSSAPSLARGTGSIETDYLNGEIVLRGRLHGIATPVNEGLCRLGRQLVNETRPAGSLSIGEIESIIAE